MALIALDRLGADAERLSAFHERYSQRLTPRATPAPVVDVGQTVSELKDGIGASAFHGVNSTKTAPAPRYRQATHASAPPDARLHMTRARGRVGVLVFDSTL